jgi:hypothetical protein
MQFAAVHESASWHSTDLSSLHDHVGLATQIGKDLIVVSISADDPRNGLRRASSRRVVK